MGIGHLQHLDDVRGLLHAHPTATTGDRTIQLVDLQRLYHGG
ncbi:hypothetical protein [Protofrankia symbiont of Coriaria ruscifolia]|nr:hypothetical protein [Protofrankia symbiont of Coriaria ruscifolia]